MARSRGMDAWTQQYCSSHIGMCFLVRNDFWYKSFGSIPGVLWHVELNGADILTQGDGPISVDLVASRLPDGVADLQIVEKGNVVMGYRTWTSNRHFVVTAPKELRASVEVIINNMTPYEAPAQ